MSLRILFAGSPDFAADVLQVLIESNHRVIGVLTKPDKPAGRGKHLQASPVKLFAESHHIPIFQPNTLKDEQAQHRLKEFHADILVVVGYGLLLPKEVIQIPRFGCVNIHPSLLPRWRGATPVQSTLLAGETKTGVTIFQINEGMDSGDILAQQSYDIEPNDTSYLLYKKLFSMGAHLLLDVLKQIKSQEVQPIPQNHDQATYCKIIQKTDAHIVWKLPAHQIANQIRAYNDWPVAYTEFKGLNLRIWEADVSSETSSYSPGTISKVTKNKLEVACGQGTLQLLKVQLPGGKIISMSDFINAHQKDLNEGVTRLGV